MIIRCYIPRSYSCSSTKDVVEATTGVTDDTDRYLTLDGQRRTLVEVWEVYRKDLNQKVTPTKPLPTPTLKQLL